MLTESDIGGFSRTQKEEQQKKDSEADITVALKKTKKTAKKQTGKQPETARTKPKQPTKRRKKKS